MGTLHYRMSEQIEGIANSAISSDFTWSDGEMGFLRPLMPQIFVMNVENLSLTLRRL